VAHECSTTNHKIKKELSICQSLLCLDLVSFPVLSQIKPQAPVEARMTGAIERIKAQVKIKIKWDGKHLWESWRTNDLKVFHPGSILSLNPHPSNL